MRKSIPIILWLLVLICGGATAYYSIFVPNPNIVVFDGNLELVPGAVFKDTPWKHLQHVPRFELTDQNGGVFDSAKLKGKPLAISFFFASCPSICRDLNAQIKRLREQLKDDDIVFVSITVDAENDTPEVLKRYAQDYDATPDRWAFLTGQPYLIKQLGERVFDVVLDPEHHTDNILLIDRWGKYRDRFTWNDPYDTKRFVKVAEEVLAEKSPPFDAIIHTRNVMAGSEPIDLDLVEWIREFHLTRENNAPFFSRELTGEVWIGSFFFTSCPGICVEQNNYLAGLQSRLRTHPAKIVSITTDPTNDTPTVLNEYSRKLGADSKRWYFCTGPDPLVRRIGNEFFRAHTSNGHHSSELFVVDRWGDVRGRFDWRKPGDEIKMFALIDTLNEEAVPPIEFTIVGAAKPKRPIEPEDAEELESDPNNASESQDAAKEN